MAERQGVKEPGLSWIWKEKYDENEERDGRGFAAMDEIDKARGGKQEKNKFGRKNTA